MCTIFRSVEATTNGRFEAPQTELCCTKEFVCTSHVQVAIHAFPDMADTTTQRCGQQTNVGHTVKVCTLLRLWLQFNQYNCTGLPCLSREVILAIYCVLSHAAETHLIRSLIVLCELCGIVWVHFVLFFLPRVNLLITESRIGGRHCVVHC